MRPARPGRKYGIRTQTYGPKAHVLPDVRPACKHDRGHARRTRCAPQPLPKAPPPPTGLPRQGRPGPAGARAPLFVRAKSAGAGPAGRRRRHRRRAGGRFGASFPRSPVLCGLRMDFRPSSPTRGPPPALRPPELAVKALGGRSKSWASGPAVGEVSRKSNSERCWTTALVRAPYAASRPAPSRKARRGAGATCPLGSSVRARLRLGAGEELHGAGAE